MLASLLPGIREIRTPLVTGYIWLISLWLIFGDYIPGRRQAPGQIRQVYSFADFFGKSAILAVVTFIAYLAGTLLEIKAVTALRPILRIRRDVQKDIHGRQAWDELAQPNRILKFRPLLTGPASETLERYVHNKVQTAVPESAGKWLAKESFRAREILTADLDQVRTRLFAANTDLYGESDRQASESDLRANVALAGAFLSIVLSWKFSSLWLLLLLVSAILMIRGVALARQANDILVQAVVTELVTSPALEQYLHEVEQEHRREETGEEAN
ncbi:hypothetical protein [Streptomyces sp. H39-C1]|uniref:hypothetical protein n=1 Tax=Streptomyces sp. H39-C1 TaxID=3004355 RepID=UPI0022AFD72C|nr:hypothetical protein [Streptomyces sp. H39-C1]MCZ4095987.1 hypothetical protein [Streptomyces sp. H39-C1]